MTINIKTGLVAISILITGINISLAQNDSITNIDKTFPLLKIKTELVNWTGLNPNIYFDYKLNNKIGINVGVLYHFTGIIWTAPNVMLKGNIYEWSYLHGLGLDLGIKFYSKPTKYYYFSCKVDKLSFPPRQINAGESMNDYKTGSVKYYDIHLRLLRGYEFYSKKSFLTEIYFGIGLIIAHRQYDLHSYVSWGNMSSNVGFNNYVIPTIHFAYNFGWQLKNKHRL
ncbi:MAG: hypothetical protein HY951_04095 [Bacteroidia bacterium]|nr:hypothetical protein [Bacteroidia bacterium]